MAKRRNQEPPEGQPSAETHEEVVSSLLDLQRRLRGDPGSPEDAEEWGGAPQRRRRSAGNGVADRPAIPRDGVAVETDDGLRVEAEPGRAEAVPERRGRGREEAAAAPGPGDRASALADRLTRLEQDLDALISSIHRLGGRGA